MIAQPVGARFWSKTVVRGSCWEWTLVRNHFGYGQFHFGSKAGGARSRKVQAHRMAWELTRGPIPAGMFVLHKCDNPPCVNPDHLFLGNDRDNSDDKCAKGRQAFTKGRTNGRAKLTDDDVIDIRTVLALGATRADIARAYAISWNAVDFIASGKTWRHLL